MLGLSAMKRLLALCLALSALTASADGAVSVSPAEKAAAQSIDANVLRAHVGFLASDLLEGRGPGTRGDALAQAYIASQFEALGLKPAGTQGYHQPFELVGMTGRPETMTFTAPQSRVELKSGLSPSFSLGSTASLAAASP